MNDYKPRRASGTLTIGPSGPVLSNWAYDILKRFVTLILPAFGTLYVSLADIWALPNPSGVSATTLAVATFLGVALNVSGRAYDKSDAKYDGVIDVSQDDDGVKYAALILKDYENPADVVAQKEVRFKVTGRE